MDQTFFKLVTALKKKCTTMETRVQKHLGLSQAEYSGLLVLSPDEQISGHLFAERLNLSVSRTSRVTTRLMEKGFIVIRQNPGNRREIEVSLTPKGVSARADIAREIAECERSILSELPEGKKQEIKDALSTLIEHM